MPLQPTSSSSFVAGPAAGVMGAGGNTQFPRSSEWSNGEVNGPHSALSPSPPAVPFDGREGRVLHINETPQGGGLDDLMARLSSVSSQYHTTEQQRQAAAAQNNQREGSSSGGAPVPPIHLDRINERSSRSSAGSNGHSNGNGKTKGAPSRSNHKHSPAPLVPPALDDRDALVTKFNPLSAQRLAAQQAAASAAVVAAAKNDGGTAPAAAMRVPAPSNEEGDEVEMAAVRSITGAAGTGGGALGDRRHEQQKLLLNGGSGGGSGGGGGYSNPTDTYADDESQDHFLCRLIPRKFRREFWAPLACVILMLAVAAIVAVVLYNNLHQKELDSFTATLESSCQQRSKLLQQNFGFAVASMQSMAGFFSVQQRYQANGTLFTESDWKLYVAQSNLPGFVEQFLFMPRVWDRDRDAFEALTGHPMTDLACLNSTFRPEIAYDYQPRDQFYFTPLSQMGQCFTTRNLTHPQGLNSNFSTHISYTHVRPRFPFYFPYQFKYPNFHGLPVGLDDLYNIDATILFPLQGVSFKSISEPVANGLLKFSERQPDLVNPRQYGIGQHTRNAHKHAAGMRA